MTKEQENKVDADLTQLLLLLPPSTRVNDVDANYESNIFVSREMDISRLSALDKVQICYAIEWQILRNRRREIDAELKTKTN